jgi:hypothetical protein
MKNELLDKDPRLENELEERKKFEREEWEEFDDKEDIIDKIGWALGFIWAGLVLLVDTSAYKENFIWWTEWYSGWSVFFTGAGIIAITLTIFRMMEPKYNRKIGEKFIFGLCLLGFGLSGFFEGAWFFVILLFAIAASILYRAFIYKK